MDATRVHSIINAPNVDVQCAPADLDLEAFIKDTTRNLSGIAAFPSHSQCK